jgi:hypothetical protein
MARVGYRLNPPPGWPPVPDGFVALPGWQPDPSWPAPPPGWQLWIPDDDPPAHARSPRNQSMSGLAIASLVLGVVGALLLTAVLSVILGITALADIRKTGKRGKGLAITGLVLSGIWLSIIILVWLPPP